MFNEFHQRYAARVAQIMATQGNSKKWFPIWKLHQLEALTNV